MSMSPTHDKLLNMYVQASTTLLFLSVVQYGSHASGVLIRACSWRDLTTAWGRSNCRPTSTRCVIDVSEALEIGVSGSRHWIRMCLAPAAPQVRIMYIARSIRNGTFRMYKQRLALGSSRYVYHSRDRQLSATSGP